MAESSNRPKDIFLKAIELPPDERAAFLDHKCGDDEPLRRQIEAMLQAHGASDSFLEKPAAALEMTVDAIPGPPQIGATREVPGTRIGPYKLLQQLGEGGMGVVFLAEQQEPVRRMVALKIIKQGMDSAQVIARFESERQALAVMDHPNIARVLDAGTTDTGRPYFVMELIKGIPITKFCDHEHLTPRERLDLFIPVCQAVQHAHHKGIIHRDIKPSDVLIALYDGKPVPKVIDFGIAKATTQKLTDRTLFTEVGSMVGTLEYMAPEQAELNNLDIDTRADIYALGVLLYELLTGSPPFSAKELRIKAFTEMLRIIREVEPPRPSTRLSGSQELPAIAASRKLEPSNLTRQVQGDLDWIVMKCLEKERGRRYETANAVVQDIQRYLTDEPVLAGPPSAGYRLRKFIKRNRGLVTAASLMLLVLIVGIIGTSIGFVNAEKSAEEERKAKLAANDAMQKAVDAANSEREARAQADERRELAEELAVQVGFNSFYDKGKVDPGLALVGTAQLLPKAAGLKSKRLRDSMYLHLSGWARTVNQTKWIFSHEKLVNDVAISNDGNIALTGSQDGTARLWNSTTGAQLRALLRHETPVVAVALSADGKVALTGTNNGTARLWDVATNSPIGAPLQHQESINVLAISADGKIAVTGSLDKTARIWDGATGKPLSPPLHHRGAVWALALSADGKIAITSDYYFPKGFPEVKLPDLDDGPMNPARIWDTATGKSIGSIRHSNMVAAVALSADGKTAITAGIDGTARIWNTTTQMPIGGPLQHEQRLTVALSADGKIAVTGGNKSARIWDATTGKLIGAPLQFPFEINGVNLSGDGRTALVRCDDQTARLLDTNTGMKIGSPLHHGGDRIGLSADGMVGITGGVDNTARLWDLSLNKPVRRQFQQEGDIRSLAFTDRGEILVAAQLNQRAWLWNSATGIIGTPAPSVGHAKTLAISSDGKIRATTINGRISQLWDTTTGEPIGPPVPHDSISAVAMSPDRKVALTGGMDKTARLWELSTNEQIGPPLEHQDWVVAVDLSADGKIALTVSRDNTARLWSVATGKPIGPTFASTGSAAKLSADGTIILTGTSNGRAQLWNILKSAPIGLPLKHSDEIYAVGFSANGKTAITGSVDKTAQVWDTTTGRPIGPPLLHGGPIIAAALNSDGTLAITACHNDNEIRLWDTATGKAILTPLHPYWVEGVAFSIDGKGTVLAKPANERPTWKFPRFVNDPDRITLWTQVTGIEADEHGNARALSAVEWQRRRDRLDKLGGAPVME